MTAAESIAVRVVDALDGCRIAYFLVGSFSSNYYGIPRSTKDADFVVQLPGPVGDDFLGVLGGDFEADPQLSFETNTGTYRQLIKHKPTPFKIEIFLLSTDSHDQMRFQRRVQVALFGRQLWLPTAEDVIITKLRWARGRDKDDARGVIAVQGDKLDWPYIEAWCGRHGTTTLLAEIRQSLPNI